MNCICWYSYPAGDSLRIAFSKDSFLRRHLKIFVFNLKDLDNPIDYHAQRLRTIYQMARQVYVHHFKEVVNSFYTVDVLENKVGETIETVYVYQGCFWHCIWYDKYRLSWPAFDFYRGYLSGEARLPSSGSEWMKRKNWWDSFMNLLPWYEAMLLQVRK